MYQRLVHILRCCPKQSYEYHYTINQLQLQIYRFNASDFYRLDVFSYRNVQFIELKHAILSMAYIQFHNLFCLTVFVRLTDGIKKLAYPTHLHHKLDSLG